MEELIEETARAIYHATGRGPKKPWADRADDYKEAFRVQARFAVETVRDFLLEKQSRPPYPYFWPDGASETLRKVDTILSGKETA